MFTTTSKDENEWQNTASLRNVCRLRRRTLLLDDRSCRQSTPKLLSRCKRCGGIVLAAIQLMLPDQLKNDEAKNLWMASAFRSLFSMLFMTWFG